MAAAAARRSAGNSGERDTGHSGRSGKGLKRRYGPEDFGHDERHGVVFQGNVPQYAPDHPPFLSS